MRCRSSLTRCFSFGSPRVLVTLLDIMLRRNPLISTAVLVFIVANAAGARSQGAQSTTSKGQLISALRKCARKAASNDCVDVADEAIEMYRRGDKTLLKPLLDLGLRSDGFLSEILFSFFGEDVLQKSPRLFLNAIASRPKSQQRELAFLAGTMDGSGMPENVLKEVRAKLRHISTQRNDPLAQIAKLCLSRVEAANRASRLN